MTQSVFRATQGCTVRILAVIQAGFSAMRGITAKEVHIMVHKENAMMGTTAHVVLDRLSHAYQARMLIRPPVRKGSKMEKMYAHNVQLGFRAMEAPLVHGLAPKVSIVKSAQEPEEGCAHPARSVVQQD